MLHGVEICRTAKVISKHLELMSVKGLFGFFASSFPGLRGSSNHAHLLGSFLLGLVSLQHCNSLLHL